jgi:hypothetical protein
MAFNRGKQHSTTERGYGTAHMTARREALARFVEGQHCHLCGKPMYRTQPLHLDHTPSRNGYRGLAHAQCNRVDGAKRGRAKQSTAATVTTHRASRRY